MLMTLKICLILFSFCAKYDTDMFLLYSAFAASGDRKWKYGVNDSLRRLDGSAVAMVTVLLSDLPIVFAFFKSDGDFKSFIDVLEVQIHLAVNWVIIMNRSVYITWIQRCREVGGGSYLEKLFRVILCLGIHFRFGITLFLFHGLTNPVMFANPVAFCYFSCVLKIKTCKPVKT